MAIKAGMRMDQFLNRILQSGSLGHVFDQVDANVARAGRIRTGTGRIKSI